MREIVVKCVGGTAAQPRMLKSLTDYLALKQAVMCNALSTSSRHLVATCSHITYTRHGAVSTITSSIVLGWSLVGWAAR